MPIHPAPIQVRLGRRGSRSGPGPGPVLVKRQQAQDPGSSPSTSTPPYGGIVIGVMALVVILGGCFYLKHLRRRAAKQQAKSEAETAAAASATNSTNTQRPTTSPANQPPAGASTGIAGSTSHDNLLGIASGAGSQPHLRPTAAATAPHSPFAHSFNPSTPPPPTTPFSPAAAAAYGSPGHVVSPPVPQPQHVHMPVPMHHSGQMPLPTPTSLAPQFSGGAMPHPTPIPVQFSGSSNMPQPSLMPIPTQFSGGGSALAAAMVPPAAIQVRPMSPQPSGGGPTGPTYVAQFAYVPQQGDELPLRPGDRVVVLKAFDDGWALVSVNGQAGSGMVPMSLLALAQQQQVQQQIGGMPGIANRFASLNRR